MVNQLPVTSGGMILPAFATIPANSSGAVAPSSLFQKIYELKPTDWQTWVLWGIAALAVLFMLKGMSRR